MNLKWIGIALLASVGFAQSPAETSTPVFEVASVRLNKSPDPGKAGLQFQPGGRFVATNIPLLRIIAIAWNLPMQSPRLALAPGVKMPDDIYDIEATPAPGTFPATMTTEARFSKTKLMVQALLEDRFKLKIREEAREQSVYALVVGKGGPEKSKFQEQDCGDTSSKMITNPACHFLDGGQGRGLHGESVTMAQVVETVNNFADRPVLDKTGLTGYFNIQTESWLPMRVNPAAPDRTPQSDAGANDSRPTLFEIFEKLGLRLESQKAIIDMVVIDHIEKPSDN